MKKLPVVKTAQSLGITSTQCRYWCKLLKLEITKKGRISYIPFGSDKLLAEVKNRVKQGINPSFAVKEVLNTFTTLEGKKEISAQPDKDNRLDGIEKAIMLLVESNKKLSEENVYLKAQNKTILSKLDTLTINLLPTRRTIAFKAWQPPMKKPLKVSLIKRLWLEIFNPEALRATS